MVNDELNMLFPRSLMIDLVIFLATLPLYGFGWEIPLGLTLGTAAMLLNITLLGYASERTVERPLKQAKRYMFSFYPRVIYTVRAVISSKKGG